MTQPKMERLNVMGNTKSEQTFGGRNATTAIENYGQKSTQYLKDNHGYAKIVGIKFPKGDKVYDYLDLKGTARTGDSPTVEVTNKWTGQNQIVPGKHTKIVSTGKGGIARNAERLDRITEKGINLKVLDPSALRAKMQKLSLMGT